MAQDTILDIDQLLDSNLAGTKDIPDFVNPPAGDYNLDIKDAKIEKFKQKAKDNRPEREALRIRIQYSVMETIETKEPPVADGSLFSETFMGDEDGLAFFKKQAKAILNVKDFGETSIRDIIDALKGAQFRAILTIRKSGEYENLVIRPVHEEPAQ